MIFHGKEGKDPYGYTIIDHSKNKILKGSEVFPLKHLIRAESDQKIKIINFTSDLDKSAYQNMTGTNDTIFRYKPLPHQSAYRLKLLSALQEFPKLSLGLQEFQLNLLVNQNQLYLLDGQEQFFIRLDSILKAKEYNCFARLWDVPMVADQNQTRHRQEETVLDFQAQPNNNDDNFSFQENLLPEYDNGPGYSFPLPDFSLGISQDVDDEPINGRKRKKDRPTKRKSNR